MKDKIRDITITEVTNGYLVKIGCCEFVFKQGELIEELTGYIKEPRKTEIEYIKKHGIRDDLFPRQPIFLENTEKLETISLRGDTRLRNHD